MLLSPGNLTWRMCVCKCVSVFVCMCAWRVIKTCLCYTLHTDWWLSLTQNSHGLFSANSRLFYSLSSFDRFCPSPLFVLTDGNIIFYPLLLIIPCDDGNECASLRAKPCRFSHSFCCVSMCVCALSSIEFMGAKTKRSLLGSHIQ